VIVGRKQRVVAALAVGTGALGAVSQPAPLQEVPAYVAPRTEVRRFRSKAVGDDYLLYVGLPRHYAGSTNRYPLVVTLDAEYAFALTRNVIEHFSDRDRLPEMILVSVAYPGASDDLDVYRRTRTRDYTPTNTLEGGYSPEMQAFSGGGPAFRRFLVDELLPFLQATYRIDPGDRTFVGHSYGGLFGAYVLVTRPETFRRYILVSPSLWYDDRMLFGMERDSARTRDTPPADVFLGVGGRENPRMSSDLLAFADVLRRETWPQLSVSTQVFADDNHDSVFPAAVTRGLRVVFGRE
jgi:predicted alpha/beta superfamily hydrolase